jgi:ketosteroid isomerase-like protein
MTTKPRGRILRSVERENIETLRAAFAVWSAGDMEAVSEYYDPDAIPRPPPGWPEPGPFVGRDAVVRQLGEIRGTWNADEITVGDVAAAGDRVAFQFRFRGVGRGPVAQMDATFVVTLRNGKIHYAEYFWDHAEALEALGLSSSPEGAPRNRPS